jgi:hypothetical protein
MKSYVIFSGTPLAENQLTSEACLSYVASNLADKKPIYFVGTDKNGANFFHRIHGSCGVMVPEGKGFLPVFEVMLKDDGYENYKEYDHSSSRRPCLIPACDIEAVIGVNSVFGVEDRGHSINRGINFTQTDQACMNERLHGQHKLEKLKHPKLKLAFEALIQKIDGLGDIEHRAESFELTYLMLQEYLKHGAKLEDLKDSMICDAFEHYAKNKAQGHPSPGMQKVGFLMLVVAALIAAQIALIPAAVVGAVGLGLFAYGVMPRDESLAMNTVVHEMNRPVM